MSKQLSDTPLHPEEQIASSTTSSLPVIEKKKGPSVFWPWLGGLLVVGVIIVGVVAYSAWNWLNNLQIGAGVTQTSTALSTVKVQRSAIYADLAINLVNVQYATSFSDDLIHAGPATVRVTLSVNNPTGNDIAIAYYDVARLLVPGQQPIAPTNLNLAASVAAGKTSTGWIDFPVAKNTALASLKLQLGNAATNELLVTIPVSGPYDAGQYSDHLYHTSLTVDYYFEGYLLVYHLNSVDVRNSYDGAETRAGQQFYVLNFTVDNPNGITVSPGYGYDYIRLVVHGSLVTPKDNTLPYGFKAGSHDVSGHVTYATSPNMHSLNVEFLFQLSEGGTTYSVSL
ncbi:MAG TPA: hypothetical protein VKV19_15255 [Ktedonobacteraceae bacterium]|nr:hypothetical protein [Ktedonobacteraceae bacterium]